MFMSEKDEVCWKRIHVLGKLKNLYKPQDHDAHSHAVKPRMAFSG